jgi:hypothetical protein
MKHFNARKAFALALPALGFCLQVAMAILFQSLLFIFWPLPLPFYFLLCAGCGIAGAACIWRGVQPRWLCVSVSACNFLVAACVLFLLGAG